MKIIYIILFSYLFISCNKEKTEYVDLFAVKTNKTGKELAEDYCARCHEYPQPQALPKHIWAENIMPKMALYLGIGDTFDEMMKLSELEINTLTKNELYPSHPLINLDDYAKIIAYFNENAPLVIKNSSTLKMGTTNMFESKNILDKSKENILIKYIDNNIFTSTSDLNKAYFFNNKLQISDSVISESPITDVKNHPTLGKVILEVGKMNPNDLDNGQLKSGSKILVKNLQRPVDLELLDINNDGVQDFVIANFGNNYGDLSWYDGQTFEKNILINAPGAVNIQILDFDKDGKNDICVLMTQAREGIWFLKNMGDASFAPTRLMSFPVYYGSSFFQLKDYDKDGDFDILYANGDNADLSIIDKPFHGLRIFDNNGKNEYKESYFLPVNGLTKALWADMDMDGDDDIVTISYFTKAEKKDSFLYLQNDKLKYKPLSISSLNQTKWISLEIADTDNDKDLDIILGSFDRQFEGQKNNKRGVFLLKNKTIN